MTDLAGVLCALAICWVVIGGVMMFFGHMARMGLARGVNQAAEDLTMRQEKWAGRVGSFMILRLWPVPALAVIGFVIIVMMYPVDWT